MLKLAEIFGSSLATTKFVIKFFYYINAVQMPRHAQSQNSWSRHPVGTSQTYQPKHNPGWGALIHRGKGGWQTLYFLSSWSSAGKRSEEPIQEEPIQDEHSEQTSWDWQSSSNRSKCSYYFGTMDTERSNQQTWKATCPAFNNTCGNCHRLHKFDHICRSKDIKQKEPRQRNYANPIEFLNKQDLIPVKIRWMLFH